jgi:Fe-S-cluster containining protein
VSSLCQACGLCCDGSLFGRVGLEPDEVEGARKRRLHVVRGAASFEQPCSALAVDADGDGESRRCSIYDDRPLSCRRFVCRLHEKYRREGGAIDAPLAVVRRVRELLASLASLDPASRAELTKTIEESFARA